jgi:hypothetical protein
MNYPEIHKRKRGESDDDSMHRLHQRINHLNVNENAIDIPDISYFLIFCFLDISELSVVSRCNKKTRQIVTAPSFLNMYYNNQRFLIQSLDYINEMIQSPLHQLVQNISLDDRCSLYVITLLPYFTRMHTLNLSMDWGGGDHNLGVEFISIFKLLAARLRKLSIEIIRPPSSFLAKNNFQHFQAALSGCTEIVYFNLDSRYNRCFSNVSFLKQMQSLQTFESDFVFGDPDSDYLIQCIRSLPSLTHLNLCCYFDHNSNRFNSGDDDDAESTHIVRQLKKLCAQPGAPPKLKHIGCIYGDIVNYEQSAHHLSQLPSLQTIDFEMRRFNMFPHPLCKFIRKLKISGKTQGNKLKEEDMLSITGLPNLTSLEIYSCQIDCSTLQHIIFGLASQLEELEIFGTYQLSSAPYHKNCELSFLTLSQCTLLKSLSLSNLDGLMQCQIPLLKKCHQLTNICVKGLSSEMQQAMANTFKIPSNLFPKLEYVCFD